MLCVFQRYCNCCPRVLSTDSVEVSFFLVPYEEELKKNIVLAKSWIEKSSDGRSCNMIMPLEILR